MQTPHFGHFFFWLRQGIEPNRARFARAAGLSDRTVDRVEQDWRTPHSGPAATLLHLSRAVGLTVDQLDAKWKASGEVQTPPRKKGPIPRADHVSLKVPRDLLEKMKLAAAAVTPPTTVVGWIESVLPLVSPPRPRTPDETTHRDRPARPQRSRRPEAQKK